MMDPAPERPLERKRSLSSGAGRKNLTINTAFTVTSNRRTKRLVLGPGQAFPGADNVQLVPDLADAADARHYHQPPKGKRIPVQGGTNRETVRVKKDLRTLVRRKKLPPTNEMLIHVNPECGYEDTRSPVLDQATVQRERQERLTTERETLLSRRGTEPIGLTIDENLTVTNVVPNTPAANAGLIAGLRLSSVNGAYVYSQTDAIDALRGAGGEVAVGLMSDTTAASLRHEKVVAGRHTSLAAADVRGKRTVANGQRVGPPFGTQTPQDPSEAMSPRPKHPGIGPPGIGPQTIEWGDFGPQEDGSIGGCPSPVHGTDDPFKPNLYIPRKGSSTRSLSTPVTRRSGGQGNKTSYQLAVDHGEVDTEGYWDRKNRAMKSGRQHISTHRAAIENQNGDIITNVESAGVMTPRRTGRDRAASPIPNRRPASCAPGVNNWEGEKRSSSAGRRFFPKDGNPHLLLEGNLPEDEASARRHDRARGLRSLTPGRYRHTPSGHGDIVGHTHGVSPLRAASGLRKQQVIDDPPKAVQKTFVPTPRHQVATPSHTDIFNLTTHPADTTDTNRSLRNKGLVGMSPRHQSAIELTQRQQPVDGATTPRRGRGLGAMAPPHPHTEYTPWGSRD